MLAQKEITETQRRLAGLEQSVAVYSEDEVETFPLSRLRAAAIRAEIDSLRDNLTQLETADADRSARREETRRSLRRRGTKLFCGAMAAAAVIVTLAIGLVLSGLLEMAQHA